MDQTQTQTIEAVRRAFNAEWNPMAAIRPDGAKDFVRLFIAHYPQIATICGNRLAKAIEIMITPGARQRGDIPGLFLVRSSVNPSGWYQVDVKNHTCTCPDHPGIAARGGMCKHRLAIGLQLLGPDWVQAENTATAKAQLSTRTEEDMKRENDRYFARQAADQAWKKQLELVDRWEWHCEQYGYYSAESDALREAVYAATHQANQLEDYANSL
jgi:hypothetical protein